MAAPSDFGERSMAASCARAAVGVTGVCAGEGGGEAGAGWLTTGGVSGRGGWP